MSQQSKELATQDAPAFQSWDELKNQCRELLKTGFLPAHLKTPEQAAAVVLKGREMKIGMMEALEGVYVIQGKVTMAGQLMLAQAYRTGLIEQLDIKYDDKNTCFVTIKRRGDASSYTARFGPAEAMAMALSGKDNYKKQPRTMFKWRAISDALRTKFPDAFGGVHTPEELGAPVRVVGDSIEVIAEQLPAMEPASTDRPSAADRLVTQDEIVLLAVKMDKTGFSVDEVRKYMQERFKKTSRKELLLSELTEIISWMEAATEPPGQKTDAK